MSYHLLTLVGTRPELIKLSRILNKIEQCFKHTFVHTGQNHDYELNEIFFRDLDLRRPDYFLESAKENAAKTIASVIEKFDEVLSKEKPDAILIYGDTNSCLGIIAAKRRQIPIFHMEAGNRCFDQRVPEELNRKIVDHLSDINMVHSEHARRYLLVEGISPDKIIKTGSPMPEVLDFYKSKIQASKIIDTLELSLKNYFIVSIHREENVDYEANFKSLISTIDQLAKLYKKKIIISTHPRTRKKLELLKIDQTNPFVHWLKPMGFFDYVKLQQNAFCVLSDSGTITEESSILNFPAVMIRQAHERPEGMDVGAVIMSGLEFERVRDSIDMATNVADSTIDRLIPDYGPKNVSVHVVKVIQSYIEFINRTVWYK